jgi:hypothetical protein
VLQIGIQSVKLLDLIVERLDLRLIRLRLMLRRVGLIAELLHSVLEMANLRREWIRNLQGLADAQYGVLVEMEALCRRGPSMAMVTELSHFDAADDGSDGFEARPTE